MVLALSPQSLSSLSSQNHGILDLKETLIVNSLNVSAVQRDRRGQTDALQTQTPGSEPGIRTAQ